MSNVSNNLPPDPSKTLFTCDLSRPTTVFPHFWEHTVGSGHATLTLRADWQAQLKKSHEDLGFRYVRFHGILCDDMGTLVIESDSPLYSFFNSDQTIDFLLSIGMKPFIELSFMPSGLSSGDKIAFHYRANVTPPRDYAAWATLINKLVQHWVERYGVEEVRQWFFEVWNEPNLDVFFTGLKEDYFQLYRYTVEAVKAVDVELKVGGPATAANAWIPEFITFCETNGLAADFISTHHYPTDAFGKPGDDTVTQLADSRRSVLRDETRTAKQQSGGRPLYYTEWSSSSNPRDSLHDECYAASFIVKTVMEAEGLVEAYSYWTFSDIFEENYFPSVPFHGGFGLLNIHGIPKPSYRAYELLHSLGTEKVALEGTHETLDAWCVRDADSVTVLFSNFALPRHAVDTVSARVVIKEVGGVSSASLRRIDLEHANAPRLWKEMGSPDYLQPETVQMLKNASAMKPENIAVTSEAGSVTFDVTLTPLALAAVRLELVKTK